MVEKKYLEMSKTYCFKYWFWLSAREKENKSIFMNDKADVNPKFTQIIQDEVIKLMQCASPFLVWV